MRLNDFLFSYKNILTRSFDKKNYFSVIRKTVNIPFKQVVNFFKTNFSIDIINLDKKNFQKEYAENLDQLFINFRCDKGSTWYVNDIKKTGHNYSIYYEKHLKYLKNKELNILELGSHEGKGIASFYTYFNRANFIGANINPFQMKFSSSRIREIFVDVSSKKILTNFAKHIDFEFDIIIDDASHNLRDILITLPILFKKLKKSGIYIIEDMDQFSTFKNLNPSNEKNTPKKILEHIRDKKYFESNFLTKEEKSYLINHIKEINIEKGNMLINGTNCSDIAFIEKK